MTPLNYEWMETIAISSFFAMKMNAQHARFQKTGSPGRVAGTEGCPTEAGGLSGVSDVQRKKGRVKNKKSFGKPLFSLTGYPRAASLGISREHGVRARSLTEGRARNALPCRDEGTRDSPR